MHWSKNCYPKTISECIMKLFCFPAVPFQPAAFVSIFSDKQYKRTERASKIPYYFIKKLEISHEV